MTQMPPPNQQPGYPMPGAIQPSTTNPMAIVSLICGIVGCLIITPIVGIITGFIGISKAKAPVGGKGMAIAGILLSLIWIAGFIGAIGVGYWGYNKIVESAKAPAIAFLNDLADGNIEKASAASSLDAKDLEPVAELMKKLGKCKDITMTSPYYRVNNGVTVAGFQGQGTFENGTKNVDIEVTIPQDGQIKVNFVKID